MNKIPFTFYSMTNTKGIRKPRGEKAGVKITSGPYTGWWCYGPYIQKRKHRPSREYYRLVNGDERVDVDVSEIDIVGLRAEENKKPFLDFLK